MSAVAEVTVIPLADAALKLGLRYQKTLDLLTTAQIAGRRDSRNRWVVDVSSVERYLKTRQQAARRSRRGS